MNGGYDYADRVGAETDGRTLIDHLATRHRHATADEWRARVARGAVTVGGEVATAEAIVHAGQVVVWHRPAWDEPVVPLHFDVVHEDAELVAVVKPRGLPTLPGGGFLDHTLLALVTASYPDAAPMHRLGRDTSGLVLFARTADARRELQAAWRAHDVLKRYRALGAGVASFDTLEITQPIGPVPHALLGSLQAAADGRPSRSVARVIERRAEATLFDVDIETGRPHQVRIHLAFAGHPLVGDPLYESGGRPRAGTRALPGDGGYLLHAERLTFRHPKTRELMELRARPPPELTSAQEASAQAGDTPRSSLVRASS